MLTNQSFKNFRFRSFFIEKELICNFLVLFFETSSSGWFSLSIDEGLSKLSPEKTEPKITSLDEIKDDFAYPISEAKELNKYINKKIKSIAEYRINEINEGCIGMYFDCGECGFSVLENDGCLSIVDGVHRDFEEEISLIRIEVSY